MYDHEGLSEAMLKHPSHTTFHKSSVSEEDSAKGITRFYRWHMDAALYDLAPPKVTTLYGINVPQGDEQTCRYDDGTGDELKVPLGTTAFVSGKTMFDILPAEHKSLAVRTKVKFAPHPFVWMAPAHAHSTGLTLETEGLELPYDKLPPWEESKLVTLPMVYSDTSPCAIIFILPICVALEEPCHRKFASGSRVLRCRRAYHRPSVSRC